MADLASQVIQGAQQTAADQGHTVGDALQAYHITEAAQNARQQLEIQKEENERNKGDWVTSQLSAIAQMPDATRRIAAKSFVQQAGSLYPTLATSGIGDAIESDAEFTKGLAATFAAQHGQDPNVISNSFGGTLPALQKHIEDTQQQEAMVKAGQLKEAGMAGRVGVMQDNSVLSAVKGIHTNPTMVGIRNQAMSIDKGLQTLEPSINPDGTLHQPTWTDVNEFKQDYSKGLSGGAISSDFKLKELGDPSYAQKLADLNAKVSANPDQPADPEAIAFWKGQGHRLNGKFDQQLAQTATLNAKGISSQFLHNPNVAPAIREAIAPYANGTWRSNPDLNPDAGIAAPSGVTSQSPTSNYKIPGTNTPMDPGYIFKGKKYLGGDPNKQASWGNQ